MKYNLFMIAIFCLSIFAFVVVINRKRISGEDYDKPKRIKRAGKHSTIYFLYDPSVNKVKFGRAVNFDRRFKTHLTSNRDLKIIRTFPETETFNETLIKRRFGQDEWVPLNNDLKLTITSGIIK